MPWILFSILAAFIWAVVNIIDKYVLEKWVRKPIVPVIILGFFGLIAGFFVLLFKGFPLLSPLNTALAFIAGIIYFSAIVLYFKAAKIEEISRVAPLFYVEALFILLLATLFLGELFTPMKYLGIVFLVSGAILISIRKFKLSFGKAFWMMMLAAFILGIYHVITKYLLNFSDFWTVFSYVRIGTFLPLIIVLYPNIKHMKDTMKEHGAKAYWVMILAEGLNLLAVLFITIATAIGFVSLVKALSSVQPFFVLLIVLVLSIFYPKILKEEIGRKTVFLKFIAIFLMFIGVMLIT
ncbi:EamA family transporter [Candidatus Woesearchaeota archaeon]|nr:EamA family transporter [Candidatus Woesearchaeota archaeon]